ncbi:MAG: hydrogenase/urease maturation nickel metallochaperone HypA [Devosia sp.]|nr:hydrogenase/urease maturation nickel metallochaperone HypA [Devosia sp.]
MHEATLMKGLMRRIEEIARDQEAVRVVGVSVWLGALSHMSPGHFAEHFEEAAAGTIAAGASLNATASDDVHHANAQDVLLESIEVET